MGHHASERVESARDVTETTFGVLSPIEPASADAPLVALGEQLEAAWAAEAAAYEKYRGDLSPEAEAITDVTYEATAAIVDQIEPMQASTVAGLRVKARAIQWCYHDDPVDLVVDQSTTDLRIANSLIADLLAVSPATVALPVVPDPMLDLIGRYLDGNRRYNESPTEDLNDLDAEMKVVEVTYGPPLHELKNETPETTTMAGAIAAIESVLDDNLVMDWGDPVLRSVLTFLRPTPGSKVAEAEGGSC